MTVGISLTNGKEAIVIADSRSTASNGGRQSDSAEKLLHYQGKNYHGFLLETGSATYTEATYAQVKGSSYDSLDHLVAAVKSIYGGIFDRNDQAYLESQKKEIEKKAALIDKEEERTRYVAQEIERLMHMFGTRKSEPAYNSHFAAAGYDANANRVRLFWINENVVTELQMPYVLIGSGSDSAHLYFTAKLQGTKKETLTKEELYFYALNAHSFATLNAGVGGTPLIGITDAEKSRLVVPERTIAAVNISGAYLAEGHDGLTGKRTKNYVAEVLEDRNPGYKAIAKELGLTIETLTTLVIPYSSWQERANRQLFPTKARN
ncbi:MAG: hypothetical protein AABX82_02025 [Nanoarchaeota archaeon]